MVAFRGWGVVATVTENDGASTPGAVVRQRPMILAPPLNGPGPIVTAGAI
jgi:hypothetical protein